MALESALFKCGIGFAINDLPESRDDSLWTGKNSIQLQFNLTPIEISALKNKRCPAIQGNYEPHQFIFSIPCSYFRI
jgi:hypothetical protein